MALISATISIQQKKLHKRDELAVIKYEQRCADV